MWTQRFTEICRQHPELIAAYESRQGHVSLLLRQTITPLAEERTEWLTDTRRAVRRITRGLRSAGLRARITVLQWRSLGEVASVLAAWSCRYEGDRARREQLTRVVFGRLADRAFVASQLRSDDACDPTAAS